VLPEHPEGVWLVDLSAVTSAALVPQALATALGVREQAGRPHLDTLIDHLGGCRLLLVVDNCEHVLDAAAALVHRVLTACSGVRVLATSREPLRVPGELRYRVPSLPHPDVVAGEGLPTVTGYDAVRLFLDVPGRWRPGFQATERNAAAIAGSARGLDGIPLAIELAAGWTHTIGVEGILERLEDRFSLLAGGPRTAAPRQQAIAATIDWSHDLLSPAERMLFRRIGVFAGGFGLSDVERVCLDARDGAGVDALG